MLFSQAALNATLNGTSGILLAAGYAAPVYFVLLTSHTILAIVIVPMILITLRRAWLEKFDKHKIIAKWTLPLWFYVCVTGVIVYWMVYQMYAVPTA